MAQAPQGFTYQGVATDNNGFELQNQTISIQASILSSSATGTTVWQETHTTTTDTFGLFNVTIGEGTSTNGGSSATFSEIDWGAASHFMKVEIDVNGGSNYVHVGTSQMMSVPYALYALNAENANIGHFYQTFSCPSLQYAGSSNTTYLVDSLTINKGGLVFVEGEIYANAPVNSCNTRMTVLLLDEFGNPIPINCFLPFEAYISHCAPDDSERIYRSGCFMASSNQKIYIYGVCQRSGVGSGSFDISIFR